MTTYVMSVYYMHMLDVPPDMALFPACGSVDTCENTNGVLR
jgi:hypothetical protein